MMIKHLSEKLSHALHNFSSADSGNVLITFALALLPIMGVVGAAVDYSRANSDKTAMQAAIDATAQDLDTRQSQHLERLHHRPWRLDRPEYRKL